MLIDFFQTLRAAEVPVSVREFLTLLQALDAGLVGPKPAAPEATPRLALEDFYHLSRTILVKDEAHYDKFDRAFGAYFGAVEQRTDPLRDIPADWLRQTLQRHLSPEELARLQAMGWEELMQTLRQRLQEQTQRHEGGNRWIGTGGTSPFGHGGTNPAGIRIGGGGKNGQRRAVKVWEQRAYRDYDDTQELGTRNIQVALRRLRRFAREGHADELDLEHTIRSTAANAGWLDLRLRPQRHNAVKVLLLMDVGGTMDDHIPRVEELFSAAKTEFKHLKFFYFHNCVYDFVWQNNRRRFTEKTATWDLLRTYNRDYKLIIVGDATMAPYEIVQVGGSVEYSNAEPGATWLARLARGFPHHVWLNPEPQGVWEYRQSIGLIRDLFPNRMFPMTLKGLEEAMRTLSR